MITVLGPKGGTGKTLTSSQPRGRARARGQVVGDRRPRPAVRRRRARARAASRRRRSTTSPSRAGRSTATRSTASSPSIPRARGRCWRRSGPDQAAAIAIVVPARGLRDPALALRLRHRRHAAGVHARGDRGGRRLLAPLRRRDARRALAQGHEDRPRDARADGLRPAGDHARAQPRRHERRHHAARTSSSCSGARPTCSSAATARSRARSRTASRSSSPSRSRRRRGRTPALAERYLARHRHVRRRPQRRTTTGGGAWSAAEGELTMELHERIANSPVAGAPLERRRNGNGSDPFAELKNRIHLALVSELGPRLFDVEDSGAVRARVESEIARPAPPGGGAVAGRPRSGSRPRSPTTSSATARSSGCSPIRRSRRSWSTARTTSGSSATAGSRRRR